MAFASSNGKAQVDELKGQILKLEDDLEESREYAWTKVKQAKKREGSLNMKLKWSYMHNTRLGKY